MASSSAWETISNKNRRRAPRYKVRLTASVSIIEKERDVSQWTTTLAYTRDVSREGLCLIMPSTRLECHNLDEGNHALRVVLVLPTEASIKLEGELVYCLPINAGEFGAGCLVGVKITELSGEERTIYHDFIDGLHRKTRSRKR